MANKKSRIKGIKFLIEEAKKMRLDKFKFENEIITFDQANRILKKLEKDN